MGTASGTIAAPLGAVASLATPLAASSVVSSAACSVSSFARMVHVKAAGNAARARVTDHTTRIRLRVTKTRRRSGQENTRPARKTRVTTALSCRHPGWTIKTVKQHSSRQTRTSMIRAPLWASMGLKKDASIIRYKTEVFQCQFNK